MKEQSDSRWKGLEECDNRVSFDESCVDREINDDMTPMVDITFLLLIFFMVTAAFVTQRSMEMNHTQASTIPGEPLQTIQVSIDQNNIYCIETADGQWESISPNEMQLQLRNVIEESNVECIHIEVDNNAWNKSLVSVWDVASSMIPDDQIKIVSR